MDILLVDYLILGGILRCCVSKHWDWSIQLCFVSQISQLRRIEQPGSGRVIMPTLQFDYTGRPEQCGW